MPHLILELSAGLEKEYDVNAVCKALFNALIQDPAIANPKALKIRATVPPYSYTGTHAPSYVHATLLFLAGRDETTQSRLTHLVLKELEVQIPNALNFSVNAQDMNPNIYAKKAQA